MSEYEIFNNENSIEVIPENKKTKKEKKVVLKPVEKKEYESSKFFKEIFNLGFLPIILSLTAIFFSLFVKFLPIFSITAAMAFFFIGFVFAFSALLIEIIGMIKEKKAEFNLKILLIGLSFFVLFI